VTETPRPGALTDGTVTLTAGADGYDVVADGTPAGTVGVRRVDGHTGELTWSLESAGLAARAVRLVVDLALTDAGEGGLGYARVEAHLPPDAERDLQVATRSGLRREGVRRVGGGASYVVLARVHDDPPLSEPGAFRALLNSFLPRKRAIAQLLVRDPDGRVLLCGLTYKTDWDLPGGVVEVGESPQVAVGREVVEELALDLEPGPLLLTDWLPPWSGWDDALCLVFDGGVHDPALLDRVVRQEREIREVAFCTLAEVHERAADFTARRIEAALRSLDGPGGPAYTESGR
jgi:8-oxo-dGTP pyrophosphatase MutT (NUDIX family)